MLITLKTILTDILTSLYQPFWFALVLSAFFMFIWKFYPSTKPAIKQWIVWFKTESSFRKMFFLVFYTVMILFRTLFNRDLYMNPLSNVIGNFGFGNTGEQALTLDWLENLFLFIPFQFLLFCNCRKKIIGNNVTFINVLWQSIKISFLFSLTIETLQLLLRLGTWQLSDLFYNTFGGLIGGLLYWCCYIVSKTLKKRV